MVISDKVKIGMVGYGVPATTPIESTAIAVLARRLGGWVQAVATTAVIVVLLLFALVPRKVASSADPDGADDWWGGVMWMKSKGGRMTRNSHSIDRGLAIMVAVAAPMDAIVSLVLGYYINLNAPKILAVAFLFTVLFIIYVVTVRALCRECRKCGLVGQVIHESKHERTDAYVHDSVPQPEGRCRQDHSRRRVGVRARTSRLHGGVRFHRPAGRLRPQGIR